VTINDSILKIERVGFIKIDVEGAEIYVIEALKNLIQRDSPFIMLEMLPAGRKDVPVERPKRQKALIQLLIELNYECHLIEKNSDDSFKKLTKLDEVPLYDSMEFVDFIFIPNQNKNV
jgi:hypothetical protein